MKYNIYVKQGDLIKIEHADFVVNPSNTRFLLGSGVSMAFKRHCGHILQQEMTTTADLKNNIYHPGDVIITSSGNASNFSYALHVAIMNYNQGIRDNDKLPTINVIRTALQNIENILQNFALKKTTLAIPLMGCGVGGLNKEEVIRVYKVFFSHEITFECDVYIYGYTKKDVHLIENIFEC